MKRFLYLDVMKTLAMFLVCAIHYPLLQESRMNNFIQMYCYTGVALFFMVNGALLLNAQNYSDKRHIKRIIKICIQLLMWEVISITFFFALYKPNIEGISLAELLSYLTGDIIRGMPTGHFWFMRTLIGIYIVYPMIKSLWNSNSLYFDLLCISVIVLVFLPHDYFILCSRTFGIRY